MANSTTNLDPISSSQSGKEVTANAGFDATSPASAFGRRASTSSGLTWGYYGATVHVDGVPTQIGNGTLTNLPPNKSSGSLYLEAGRVSATTKAVTAITKAANAQITASSHGYSEGDILYISTAVAGMVEIKGTFCRVVSVVDANNITVDIASTSFTTYTSGGTLAKASRYSGTVTMGKAHAWHAGLERLYRLTTGASTVSSYTDYRTGRVIEFGWPAISMGSDANLTLSADQVNAPVLQVSSSVSLTATRDIVLPDGPLQWTVFNTTTGAQSLQFKTAAGTGITVANGKRAIIYADGVNVMRVTADV